MGMESSLIGGGLSLLGGALGGSSAADAARSSADAQVRAAQIAADAAKFRPVGITNRGSMSMQSIIPGLYCKATITRTESARL